MSKDAEQDNAVKSADKQDSQAQKSEQLEEAEKTADAEKLAVDPVAAAMAKPAAKHPASSQVIDAEKASEKNPKKGTNEPKKMSKMLIFQTLLGILFSLAVLAVLVYFVFVGIPNL